MEILQEAPDIFSFQLLTPQLCAELVDAGRGAPWKKARVHRVSGRQSLSPYDRRCSDCDVERLPAALRRKLAPLQSRALEIASLCWQWPIKSVEAARLVRYDKGGYFKKHFDHLPGVESPARIISLVCYLDDGYAGGRTVFPRQNFVAEPKVGKALLFPSGITHPHKAEPVRNGSRHVLIAFFR